MKQYLVILRHTMDDLPVGLFPTWDEAHAYAWSIGAMPCEWDRDIFATDCSTPCAVAIATFEGCFVKDFEIVRELDYDDGEDDGDEPQPTSDSSPSATV